MTVWLYNPGHGLDTEGKCSPDRSLVEAAWAREIVRRVFNDGRAAGLNIKVTTWNFTSIPLKERVAVVNEAQAGSGNAAYVSVHANAAGSDGKWREAEGIAIFSRKTGTPSALTRRSLRMAGLFLQHLTGATGLKSRGVRTAAFTELYTRTPSILVEHGFQDNKEESQYLLSEEGKSAIVRAHVASMIQWDTGV